ncbi:MAG: hypothetical protein J6565_07605 [Lactobacillus sp.]|nr:hypothetical protein [Lactobacillus sp.]
MVPDNVDGYAITSASTHSPLLVKNWDEHNPTKVYVDNNRKVLTFANGTEVPYN